MKNVTVVIPVYKDWESLNRCLESLKKYLGTENQVLLVNDMGSDWKQLEIKIRYSIGGCKNFKYYKNKKNIGFVKTCNRAVLNLDETQNDILLLNSDTEVTEGFLHEMKEILASDSSIGVVCPRSNRATFLSIPVNKNENINITREQSYRIFQSIKLYLPQMEEIWTGVGFAFLIKREIIDKIGLFDEIFGKGYNEENDFCMRIRREGYKVMKANHAYVFHDEGKSFLGDKNELELKNSSILLRRYPEYWKITKEYEKYIDPVDYFADLLVGDENLYKKKRVLICILQDLCSSELGKNILDIEKLIALYNKKFSFELLVSKKNYKKVKMHYPKVAVLTGDTIVGTYHFIYSLFELGTVEKIILGRKGVMVKEKAKDESIEGMLDRVGDGPFLDSRIIITLKKRWESYIRLEKALSDKEKKKMQEYPGKIRTYLYAHHIWIYIWWHKIRKYL